MKRPFRFAIQGFSSTSLKEWVDLARKVEGSGYSTLHVADHLLGPGSKIEGTGHRVQTLAIIPAIIDKREGGDALWKSRQASLMPRP